MYNNPCQLLGIKRRVQNEEKSRYQENFRCHVKYSKNHKHPFHSLETKKIQNTIKRNKILDASTNPEANEKEKFLMSVKKQKC